MNRPVATLAVVWVAGTAVGGTLPGGLLSWKTMVVALALAAMAALLAVPGRRPIGWLLVFVAACAYYQGYDAKNTTTIAVPLAAVAEPADSLPTTEWEATLSGTIASRVDVDGDKVSFVLEVETIASEGGEQEEARDRVQVSIRLLRQEEQQRAAEWGRGDNIALSGTLKRPEPPRNFGGFDYRLYLYRHHIHWLLSAKGLDSVRHESDALPAATGVIPPSDPAEGERGEGEEAVFRKLGPGVPVGTRLLRLNDDARYFLGGVFDSLFGGEGADAGYLKSLVIGLTDDMDPELYQQFSQLGLTHILAISGLHVAVFVGGCMWIMRLFRLTREKAMTVTMALIPLYMAISGGSPSVIRAGIMGMIGLYLAKRRIWKEALNVIGLAAVVMLLWEPYYLYNVSFQLSFLVTIGLIVGVPRFSALLPIRSAALQSLVSVTIVAQLVSFPVTVYYFNGISLLSAAANLILVPFISSIVLPLGTVALLIGALSVQAAYPLGWLVSKINAATFWLIDIAATHDPFRLVWPKPSLLWVATYYALLGAVYAGVVRWKGDGRPAMACVSLAVLIVFLWHGFDPDRFERGGQVRFIDVGQGDAILVRTPQGRHMLIDGGGTVSFRKPGEEWKERKDPYEVGRKLLVPLLKQRGVHRIDLLVLSHQDQDHMGGLQAVIEHIPVRRLLLNGTWKGNESSRKLLETAMKQGIELVTVPEGGRIALDRYTELDALVSGGEGTLRLAEEQNGESLVLLMRMYGSRFLFTGDMRADNEETLLARLRETETDSPDGSVEDGLTAYAPVDVLKVAHHGSKTSTTEGWLAYWKPTVSVISAGVNNVYGHPNPGVLERLEQSGTVIRRTDQEGEIAIGVTKDGLHIETKR